MKIIHVISTINDSSGGPSRSVPHLIESMLQENDDLFIQLNTIKSVEPLIEAFENKNGHINFCSSHEFKKELADSNVHLFHGHGLWQHPVHQMVKVARKKEILYIISPRGMLDTWPLNHKRFKKKLARILFQDKDLKYAAALHATSNSEAQNIRKLGFKNPIAVIPNGIQLNPIWEHKKSKGKKKILFLSRLIKNKGIEDLFAVWNLLDAQKKIDWELIIVGEGETKYVEKLKQMKKDLKLENVFFKGPVYGPEKIVYFEDASLFVLPSFTENFGVAIAEALSYQVPVITTKGAPWEDLETYHCGWWIDIGVQPLQEALEEAMQTKEAELLKMGQNGRQLIEDKYNIGSVAKQMLELYDWILHKGEKPNFVSTY